MTTSAPAKFQNARLALEVESGTALDPRTFKVREALSTLYEITLEVVSHDPDIALETIIGRPARFALVSGHDGEEMRAWEGVCRSIEQVQVEDVAHGLSTYEMTIVPAMWFLTQRRNHRIFQQKSEPQIAIQVLQEWGFELDARVALGTYPSREYRVQYGESDFAFVSRMLEDVGITYFFEGRTIVLSDAPHHRALTISLPFASNPTAITKALVTGLRLRRQVRPGRYTQRDIDHRRAPDFQVLATQAAGLDPESRLERFHYVPGAFLFQQSGTEAMPAGDDRGVHRADLSRGGDQVQRRLDAKRGNARVVAFRVHEHALAAGEIVAITGHPRHDVTPDRHLLVVRAEFEGSASLGEWVHSVETRFTDIPFRPPIATRKPRVSGIESATVVGPAGEEIHVDEMGRIRVHFHWDRESQMDEQSSCWVPVSHPWGGAGYGAVNLPRIGQEVIVDFLGGDPDRPVVVGRVYTGVQQVPYALPANKTQSGLKSFSSPATGGYNEVMFEDAAGRELVRIQAERNLDSLVKNDETTTVRRDSTSLIGRNQTHMVGGEQSVLVVENRMAAVLGDEMRVTRGSLIQGTVEGVMVHHSPEPILIESDTEIVLKVGETTLTLVPDHATLESPQVDINPPTSILSMMLEAPFRMMAQLQGNP